MATLYWLGTADAVAQVHTASIDSVDATPSNNTFTVTIGGVAISQVGDTDAGTTAASLVVKLNASTHPYFAAVTWTNPSAGNIVGTADTAGVPFVAALTETGAGSGAVTDFAETTASAGPNDWSTAANWSTGSVPVNSDVVIIADNSVPICWGLAQSGVTLTSLRIDGSYTGRIGLRYTQFATSADGGTFSATTKTEYRAHYLAIKSPIVDIGEDFGPNTPAGSGRIKIDPGTTASQLTVHGTASTSADTNKAAVRILANNSSTDIYVRSALAGVAIAGDEPDETSTVGDINISEDGSTAQVYASGGVTMTNWVQGGGNNILDAAATVTAVTCDGGLLLIEGDYTITTLNVRAGVVTDNHIKTSGNAVTTVNATGGEYDLSRSRQARTLATVNASVGATIRTNEAVTITTLNEPTENCTIAFTK